MTDAGENGTQSANGLEPSGSAQVAGGIKVLFLVTDAYGGVGGIAAYNRAFAEALLTSPRVSAVTVLPRLVLMDGISVPANIQQDISGLGGVFLYGKACILRAITGERFDRVHCGHINLLPFAQLVARARGVPCSLTIHGIDAWTPPRRAWARAGLHSLDKILAVSQETADRFIGWSGLTHVEVVPNCVQLDHFGPGPKDLELLRRYGLSDRIVLMTLGRLAGKARAKGFDEVIDILPELAQTMPSVAYLICGGGPDRERLEAKAYSLGVGDRVVFAGYVAEDEKVAHYRLADVFVMPSRGEGFGIVLLEAMACGIPAIGSVADGSREALLGGKLGTLVDPDVPQQLVTAILEALARGRQVPPGLEYYSFERFAGRVCPALGLHSSAPL